MLHQGTDLTGTGYCFIDASTDRNGDRVVECERLGDPGCLGDPRLIADCPERSRRRLRFASPPDSEIPFPQPGAYVFGTCEWPLAFRAD